MAAVIISRKAPLAKILEKLMASRSARALAPPSQSDMRSFNANARMREVDDDSDSSVVDRDRRSADERIARRRLDSVYPFLSGLFDPSNSTNSLSQVRNLMDQMTNAPLPAPAGGALHRGWVAKEDDDALHLRVDMPGLGKEHVKVSAEQNTLSIKGEGEKESEEDESGRRYGSRIELPEGRYKMDKIRAAMKDGVLKVTVPKVKEEERKDVFQVQIE